MKVSAKNKTHATASFSVEELKKNPKLAAIVAQFMGDGQSFDEPGVEEHFDDSHLGPDGQPDLSDPLDPNGSGADLGADPLGHDGQPDSAGSMSEIEGIFSKHGKQLPPELHQQIEQALAGGANGGGDELGGHDGHDSGNVAGDMLGDMQGGAGQPSESLMAKNKQRSRFASKGRLSSVGGNDDFMEKLAATMAKIVK